MSTGSRTHTGPVKPGISVRWDALWENLRGALWVVPAVAVLIALVAGSALSLIDIGTDSPLHPLVFQGTADDARTLLIGISGTMITVVALVLGLTVVALQLSSTQFSPRLLRNFLRDRPNQIVLGVFVATFAYSAAGLYTVGVSDGSRTESFPRLAVSGALALLITSLFVLIYFAHHLAHSIQIDEIMRVVERGTLTVIKESLPEGDGEPPPVPPGATPIAAPRSGYVQTIQAGPLAPVAGRHRVNVCFVPAVGDHVIAGTPVAYAWPGTGGAPGAEAAGAAVAGTGGAPGAGAAGAAVADAGPAGAGGAGAPDLHHAVRAAIRIGFERTMEQDAAFGIRQLVDIASKALSAAINDPYTAIQSIDHLSVLVCALAGRPLGTRTVPTGAGTTVSVPGHTWADYLRLSCALVRRYGAHEPAVALAQLRLLRNVATVLGPDEERLAVVAKHVRLLLSEAERRIAQPADLEPVQDEAHRLLNL